MRLITEWKELRRKIQEAPARARALDQELTEALYHYRTHLTKLKTKPHVLDRKIWKTYDSIVEEMRHLNQRSKGRLLKRPSHLSGLARDWSELFDRQRGLLEMIDETIDRSNFYNKMETAKLEKGRRSRERDEQEASLSEARRGLIRAFHYLLLRQRSGESITSDSIVLDLNQAIDTWEDDVARLHGLQSRQDVSVGQMVEALEELRQRIVNAPLWAENVKLVEGNLDELLTLDNQLRGITGVGQLASADVHDAADLLRINANQYWVTGQWDQLDAVIEKVQGYIQREIAPLQSQLYVRRKRKGRWGPKADASGIDAGERRSRYPSGHRSDHIQEGQSETGGAEGAAKGSLERVLDARPSASETGRVFIDPDADESVRRAFEQDGTEREC